MEHGVQAPDETLLIQSGKPVGVFRTHEDAPRVLLANSNLVPHWATWEHFHELDRRGLMMYGQMTAGSWIYIGSQGIVQGTYETFVEMGRQHYGGDLAGRWILTAGLGGMGGAQPLAGTMAGFNVLAVECDETRIDMRPVVRFPIKQTMSVQMPDHLNAMAHLKTTLPIDTSVTVEQMVPVKTTLNMQVKLRSWLPGMPVSVPVTLNVPLKLTVPVKAEVPVDMDVAISGELPPTLNIPIDTVFSVRPHVKGVVTARMSSQTAFKLLARLRLLRDELGVTVHAEVSSDAPSRCDRPWRTS